MAEEMADWVFDDENLDEEFKIEKIEAKMEVEVEIKTEKVEPELGKDVKIEQPLNESAVPEDSFNSTRNTSISNSNEVVEDSIISMNETNGSNETVPETPPQLNLNPNLNGNKERLSDFVAPSPTLIKRGPSSPLKSGTSPQIKMPKLLMKEDSFEQDPIIVPKPVEMEIQCSTSSQKKSQQPQIDPDLKILNSLKKITQEPPKISQESSEKSSDPEKDKAKKDLRKVAKQDIDQIVQQYEDSLIQDLPNLAEPNKDNLVLVNVDRTDIENYLKPIPNLNLKDSNLFVLNEFPAIPWMKRIDQATGQLDHSLYWRRVMNRIDSFLVLDEKFTILQDLKYLFTRMMSSKQLCNMLFPAFESLYLSMSSDEKRSIVKTIREMLRLVKKAPELFPEGIPLLRTTPVWDVDLKYPTTSICDRSVTLSQEQCACLMACAFFGMFSEDTPEQKYFNFFNVTHLMQDTQPLSGRKLRFLLEYFMKIVKEMPRGVVTFRRISYGKCLDIPEIEKKMDKTMVSDCILYADSTLIIEDQVGHRQMDFANEFIGGGVLGQHGSAQEEIRFLLCPEMIVSCFLCEKMDPRETIQIIGAQRFSSYSGYGHTLNWKQYDNFGKEKTRNEFGRINNIMIAIDAICYRRNVNKQFDANDINRDLIKCIAGFEDGQPNAALRRPVATGFWGCGAFSGNPQFKALLQILAGSLTNSPLSFSTFGQPQFANQLQHIYQALCRRNVSAHVLYQILLDYKTSMGTTPSVFTHVMQASKKYTGID
ncbi:hypothetical protein WR25_24531 isoform A [Diploscapter pachys]|uniref:poly(ADP-ribose) glycohydrolase n=2 Tax=Diploscapter pachys TaxID=2018661 RepID=A0A2A2JRH8_9BILA|nr:hypothetical protein WR25_24531 isoform A [Diploscapter pachys]